MEGSANQYFNEYQKSRWQYLLQTLKDQKWSSGLILIFLIFIFSVVIFSPFKDKVNHAALLASIGWISPWIISFIGYWLYAVADEKSISFQNDKLIITYPKPKKTVEISYENIIQVFFNKVSSTNEVTIVIPCKEKDLNRLGVDETNYDIYSLSLKDWQEMATLYKFRLITDYILEAEDSCNYYVLSKSDGLISQSEINQIVQENNIKFLGKQGCLNCEEKEFTPIAKYQFNINSRVESFQFNLDKIMITYRKGKKAKEIYNLAEKYHLKVEKI
jgi:hypothetical protein